METRQWPLTAAATQMLVALPASNEKPGDLPGSKVSLKLGLKELVLRGAFRLEIGQGYWGSRKVTLVPQEGAMLPPSLESLDEALRPWAPAEVPDLIRRACKASSRWWNPMGELAEGPFRQELSDDGLIDEHRSKVVGLLPVTKWRRTEGGDAWAATGAEHLRRLESLPVELESHPQSAARVAAMAGAMTIMVPGAMASVARMHRRRRIHGGDLDLDFAFAGEDSTEVAFDPFYAVATMFDSVLEGSLDGLDAGLDAVDSALESVADSIDSAVDSGVDAGGDGGDGGGGDGGGGS